MIHQRCRRHDGAEEEEWDSRDRVAGHGVPPPGCDGGDERVSDQGGADADGVGYEGGDEEGTRADESLDGDADGEQNNDADEGT